MKDIFNTLLLHSNSL